MGELDDPDPPQKSIDLILSMFWMFCMHYICMFLADFTHGGPARGKIGSVGRVLLYKCRVFLSQPKVGCFRSSVSRAPGYLLVEVVLDAFAQGFRPPFHDLPRKPCKQLFLSGFRLSMLSIASMYMFEISSFDTVHKPRVCEV